MQRFIARQNLARFQHLLAGEPDDGMRLFLQQKILETQRELALLNARADGLTARFAIGPSPNRSAGLGRLDRYFQAEFERGTQPYLLLDPRPGLRIVDVNDAYSHATMASRPKVAGERLFDVFPDNPGDPAADGVANLYASLSIAVEMGRPHEMRLQRYDDRNSSGQFVERYWRPRNTPIFDEDHRLLFLLHHVEDVTEMVLRQRSELAVAHMWHPAAAASRGDELSRPEPSDDWNRLRL